MCHDYEYIVLIKYYRNSHTHVGPGFFKPPKVVSHCGGTRMGSDNVRVLNSLDDEMNASGHLTVRFSDVSNSLICEPDMVP